MKLGSNFYNTKDFLSDINDVDVKNGIVTGYFANFDSIDSDGDMIVKGAFAKTIKERGANGTNSIQHLLQHNIEKSLGKPHVLREDKKGLYFETKIVTTGYGVDTLKLYEAGVYNEHSVGFKTIKYEKVLKPKTDIVDYWKLLELYLYEGSTVTFGANQDTPFTGLKNNNKNELLESLNNRMNKIIKGLKIADLTDETYKNFELQLRQVQQLYNDTLRELESLIKNEPEESTHEKFEPMKFIINNLKTDRNG